MKRAAIFVIGLAALLALSLPAQAAIVQGDGSATITAGAGTITIVLTDIAVNPVDILQNISGITFSTSTGAAVGSTLVTATGATFINVGAGGVVTPGTGPAVWFYSGTASAYTLLWNGFTGTTGPAFTIIGAPGAGGVYTAANGSIDNNGPHNPFINQTATFVLNIAGITASTEISNVTILFGTSPTIPPPPQVPEPGTLILLGIGLVGLAGLGKKFKR